MNARDGYLPPLAPMAVCYQSVPCDLQPDSASDPKSADSRPGPRPKIAYSTLKCRVTTQEPVTAVRVGDVENAQRLLERRCIAVMGCVAVGGTFAGPADRGIRDR